MPGNQGGSNWGTTAANPDKGIVYVLGIDSVAILKLYNVKEYTGRAGGGGANQAGAQAYAELASAETSCRGRCRQDLAGTFLIR